MTAVSTHDPDTGEVPTPDTDARLALYRSMTKMRVFEKRAYDLFLQNLVKGTSHLSLGQEAVAAMWWVAASVLSSGVKARTASPTRTANRRASSSTTSSPSSSCQKRR